MSTFKIPDYRSKQKLLYIDKTNPGTLQNYGDSFFGDGRVPDALEFYIRANYDSGLQKVKDAALQSGDAMLFAQAAKALRQELKPADWEAVGKKAIELKKYSFARHALEKAGNEEMLNSLKNIMQKEAGENRA